MWPNPKGDGVVCQHHHDQDVAARTLCAIPGCGRIDSASRFTNRQGPGHVCRRHYLEQKANGAPHVYRRTFTGHSLSRFDSRTKKTKYRTLAASARSRAKSLPRYAAAAYDWPSGANKPSGSSQTRMSQNGSSSSTTFSEPKAPSQILGWGSQPSQLTTSTAGGKSVTRQRTANAHQDPVVTRAACSGLLSFFDGKPLDGCASQDQSRTPRPSHPSRTKVSVWDRALLFAPFQCSPRLRTLITSFHFVS